MNHNDLRQSNDYNLGAIILWILFSAILFAAAVVTWPKSSVPNLTEIPLDELGRHEKQWVMLQPDGYTAGEQFDTAIYQDSTLLFLKKKYPNIHIRLTDGCGQSYWMAAQVSQSTYQKIKAGQKTMLYGTLLPLEEKQIYKQWSAAPSGYEVMMPYCLYDSGDTPFLRSLKSIGFAATAILFLKIAILIGRVSTKKHGEEIP